MFEIDITGKRRQASNYIKCYAYLTNEGCVQSVKHSDDLFFNACRDCPVFIAGSSELADMEKIHAKCGMDSCETDKEISEFDQNYH